MATRAAAARKVNRDDARSLRDRLADLFEMVVLIRTAEERLSRLFADGEVPGFIHLSIGQEAVSAGVMSALGREDTIASTHRGHGHALAKGLSLDGFFAELLAKDQGLCRGRGGSMHVADMPVGMLGANGIVGAGLSIALGSALAHRTLKRDAVAVAFFGDGALAEGLIHETMNMAKLWKLPMLFVCENNGWGEFLPTSRHLAFSLESLAQAYGIEHHKIDGNDALQVADAAAEIVASIRKGNGPIILECLTTRVRGHFEGDKQAYRDPKELADLAKRDPMVKMREALLAAGEPKAKVAALEQQVTQRIEDALAKARAGADSRFDDAIADVYSQS
jgi:pyruvate dehydrogenase E1 component alpha subunit